MSERLVAMANQIGQFFTSQRSSDPAADIADHLSKFWDPRMRADIIAYVQSGGDELDPQTRMAVQRLNKEENK